MGEDILSSIGIVDDNRIYIDSNCDSAIRYRNVLSDAEIFAEIYKDSDGKPIDDDKNMSCVFLRMWLIFVFVGVADCGIYL